MARLAASHIVSDARERIGEQTPPPRPALAMPTSSDIARRAWFGERASTRPCVACRVRLIRRCPVPEVVVGANGPWSLAGLTRK